MHAMQSLLAGLILLCCFTVSCNDTGSTATKEHVRLSRMVIKPGELDNFKQILKKHIEEAKRKAPGTKTLYPVFEAGKPNHLTLLEVYVSREDYQYYLKSPHYSSYKEATSGMIEAMELLEATSLLPLED